MPRSAKAAVRSINGNGDGHQLKVARPAIERRTAKWGSIANGSQVWSQDVVSCTLSEWNQIKDDAAYAGWHVCLFALAVVAISPIRPPGR